MPVVWEELHHFWSSLSTDRIRIIKMAIARGEILEQIAKAANCALTFMPETMVKLQLQERLFDLEVLEKAEVARYMQCEHEWIGMDKDQGYRTVWCRKCLREKE